MIYGVLGMYTSLLYNINVATSVTSQGRAMVSSMALCFEQFLANNVQYGSLNECLESISHVIDEKRFRKFDDRQILDNPFVSNEDCFAKVVMNCGYRWVPTESELEIIWQTICNLDVEDRNRVYYKNNLYEFMSNSKMIGLVRKILKKLDKPILNSLSISKDNPEVINECKLLGSLLFEYVYYPHMFIDRIDHYAHMIRSVVMVSDTDSTIISLDAWYRFVVEQMSGDSFKIANDIINPEVDPDDINKERTAKVLDYNFETDEIVEREHSNHPEILTANDNMRYSIINIMAFVLDGIVNDYMEVANLNMNSIKPLEDDYVLNTPINYVPTKVNYDSIISDIDNGVENPIPDILTRKRSFNRGCRIIAKTEFYMLRLMMTQKKKNYASLIAIQEGNIVPEDAQYDSKGIEVLTKSTKTKKTRDRWKAIVMEDILKSPVIDQLKFIKDVAIFEKEIINSVESGSKEYYKPATIKSASAYDDPMRIQGIKASIAWNSIRDKECEAINLDERNAVSILKVNINMNNIDKIQEEYPEVYDHMKELLASEDFGYKVLKSGKVNYGTLDAIALPLDQSVPDWLIPFIDYDSIVADNIGGFPYESIGIQRLDKRSSLNYTNILQL